MKEKNNVYAYKVIYHLINGEIKEVIFKNNQNQNKGEIIQQLCRWTNGSFEYFANEDITTIVSMNQVCFFDVVELKKEEKND